MSKRYLEMTADEERSPKVRRVKNWWLIIISNLKEKKYINNLFLLSHYALGC
jgi:hypothetical protein